MPVTLITHTAYGRAALDYAQGHRSGRGHNGHAERNILVGGVNLLPQSVMPYADQMQRYWNLASSRNKNQLRRIVGSFSKNELDPDDPNSAYIAMDIMTEFCERYYPYRQAAIYIQRDGKGGCLHGHMLINNVSMTDHLGCTDEQTRATYVEDNFDKVVKDHHVMFDPNCKLRAEREKMQADKITQHERNLRQENDAGADRYIWKDDLKERIRTAMSEARDRSDFVRLLAENGVSAEFCDGFSGHRKASKKNGAYILYELTDISGFGDDKVPQNLKSKSYKLGSNYGIEALDEELAKKEPETFVNPLRAMLEDVELEQEQAEDGEGVPEKVSASDMREAFQDMIDRIYPLPEKPIFKTDREHADDLFKKARAKLDEVRPDPAVQVKKKKEQEKPAAEDKTAVDVQAEIKVEKREPAITHEERRRSAFVQDVEKLMVKWQREEQMDDGDNISL